MGMNPEELPRDGTWGGMLAARKEPTGRNGTACLHAMGDYNPFGGAGMERGNTSVVCQGAQACCTVGVGSLTKLERRNSMSSLPGEPEEVGQQRGEPECPK